MSDLSDIERLAIQQACYDLAVDYADIVDSRDWSRFREIFTDDAVFGLARGGPMLRGLDNIIAAFNARPATGITQHFITNIRVRVQSPTAASGSARVLLYTAPDDAPESPEGRAASPKQMTGVYKDRYLRTSAGWRFAERIGTITLHT
jgi:ketosteroid isomerase-like protein